MDGSPSSAATTPLPLSRSEAWDLFAEWTSSESLRRHVLAVEAAMRAYARRFGEDEEVWGQAGLLHDLDYERFPSPDHGHPRIALEELRRRGYPSEVLDAVAGHAEYLDVPRVTPMARALYAVDELCGFIAACAYVRPGGVRGLTPKSVKKKLKQPSFAAAIDREAVRRGAAELGVDFDEHVAFVIAALEPRAGELGLEGPGA
jgi:putative nucleotidyltransferase with HDIG domain